ncbi:MAG: prepilin-type N-terminal cleavage/methylation domain-containing protein [Gammaproteobacteria bacterium]
MGITRQNGVSIVELLAAIAILAILITGMSNVIDHALKANQSTQQKNNTALSADFAMQRMVNSVATTRLLLVPQNNKPLTAFSEHIREQTIPVSPPESGSSKATAVLAVTLPISFDLDGDNVPDADNDKDGRIDEDYPRDATNDNTSGIIGIDDGGNGVADECFLWGRDDDDEYLCVASEDPIDSIDDDDDNNIDEDSSADMNDDNSPGIAGVDDDGDGATDEGDRNDDDEDGSVDEDWLDPVVYYLNDSALIERIAVPWDENSSGSIDGKDYIESTIAENVTRLRFERIPMGVGERAQLVEITLELTPPDSQTISLSTKVRVGGAL